MRIKTVKPYPGMIITESVIFEKGEYDFFARDGIIIGADNITIDGNGAHFCGGHEKSDSKTRGNTEEFGYENTKSPDNAKELGFFGIGIYAEGKKGVTIKNLKVSGFDIGMHGKNGSNFVVDNCDFSDCFTDPAWGWDDHGFHGGILFEHMHECCIKNCKATNVWDALNLRFSNDNKVFNNNFSHTSDTGLKLWNACRNEICDNDFSYGIRKDPGEVHARDSSGVLIESGSNDNIFKRNDMTYGGDGLFIRALNGWMSTGNYFEENDCSYANNNAIEAWADGNIYIRNKANYSSYGFWLGGSDNTVLIGNEVAYNGGMFNNAPEAFGNSGIAIVNGSGSHIIMEDNHIHNNNGPGVAIRYNKDYPSFHWVIQGNRIENNKTIGNYKGHGIYVKNAKWITFGKNEFSGNDGEPIFLDTNVSDVVFLEGENQDTKVKASFTMEPEIIYAGDKVRFDAAGSSPNEESLNYRWDFGDDTVDVGERVEHTFKEEGFYRMGLTVDNGSNADIAYKNIYVLPSCKIFGTNDDSSEWVLSGNAESYEVIKDLEYTVSGHGSICAKAGVGNEHTLVYPASGELGLDLGMNRVFNTYIRYVTDADPDWGRKTQRPIITFFDNEENFIELTPKMGMTERLFVQNNEEKDNWQLVSIDIDDHEGWEKHIVGKGLEGGKINKIRIDYGNTYIGVSRLWIDAMCFTQKREQPLKATDIALNKYGSAYPKPISSDGASHSDVFAPISGEDRHFGDITPRFATDEPGQGYYGVEFGCVREYDRVDVCFYSNLTKTLNSKDEAVPVDAWIEIKNGDVWDKIPGAEIKPQPGCNTFTFESVFGSGIRVRFNCNVEYIAAINRFSVYNTSNVICSDKEGINATITSNRENPIIVDAFEVKLNKEINGNGNPLGDLIARVYELDSDEQLTKCLYEKLIPKEDIIPYAITKIDAGISNLESGKRYALALGQTELADSRTVGDYYRWIAGKTELQETFGIYHNGETKPSDYDWGTAYLRIFCAGMVADYSNESEHVGVRFGIKDMEYRYMTFVIPHRVNAIGDGLIDKTAGWIAEGVEAEVCVAFPDQQYINGANLWIDGAIPDSVEIICEGKTIASAKRPDIGLVRFNFDKVIAKKFTLRINSTSGSCLVRELELKKSL